jgi:hypothetical protein
MIIVKNFENFSSNWTLRSHNNRCKNLILKNRLHSFSKKKKEKQQYGRE